MGTKPVYFDVLRLLTLDYRRLAPDYDIVTDSVPKTPVNPPCSKCGQPTRITLILPTGPKVETRTFKCTSCGHEETATFKYE
jgi:hypothetical protein